MFGDENESEKKGKKHKKKGKKGCREQKQNLKKRKKSVTEGEDEIPLDFLNETNKIEQPPLANTPTFQDKLKSKGLGLKVSIPPPPMSAPLVTSTLAQSDLANIRIPSHNIKIIAYSSFEQSNISRHSDFGVI